MASVVRLTETETRVCQTALDIFVEEQSFPTYAQIGLRLGINQSTVGVHVKNIAAKIEVHDQRGPARLLAVLKWYADFVGVSLDRESLEEAFKRTQAESEDRIKETIRGAQEEVLQAFGERATALEEELRESIDRQFRDVRRTLAEFLPTFDMRRPQAASAEAIRIVDADGVFVVPKPSSVADKLGIKDPFGTGYGQLLETSVLTYLGAHRSFRNGRAGELTSDRITMRESAVNALRKLEENTPGDFLVFPAQTGIRYAGCSVRYALWEIEHGDEAEFPLPAWCVANILLTDPERMPEDGEYLWIDCPGDEYRVAADAEFDHALCFSYDGGALRVDDRPNNHADGHFGSASGWALFPRMGGKGSGPRVPRTTK